MVFQAYIVLWVYCMILVLSSLWYDSGQSRTPKIDADSESVTSIPFQPIFHFNITKFVGDWLTRCSTWFDGGVATCGRNFFFCNRYCSFRKWVAKVHTLQWMSTEFALAIPFDLLAFSARTKAWPSQILDSTQTCLESPSSFTTTIAWVRRHPRHPRRRPEVR